MALQGVPDDWGATAGNCFVPCASFPGTPWYVAFTHPQHEHETERQLRDEGAGVWVARDTVRLPNRQIVERLTFPRYVFLQLTGERGYWGCTIRTRSGAEIASVLRSPAGHPIQVPLAVLERFWRQCDAAGVIQPSRVDSGDKVWIAGGPLHGIVRLTDRERVEVLWSLLGREKAQWFPREDVRLMEGVT